MELQIEILNDALTYASNCKNRFDFDIQIKNDYLCMITALIRNEFLSNLLKRDIVNHAIMISNKDKVKLVLKENTLVHLSIFDKILIKGLKKRSRILFYLLLYAYRTRERLK